MKSFHLSGPKFDIAAEMFCVVEFSIRGRTYSTHQEVLVLVLGVETEPNLVVVL